MKVLDAVIVLLALGGVLVSALALGVHYNTQTTPCSINDKWDCGAVNHSPYAVINGVPVALVGIMGYALLGVLAGRARWLTLLGAATGSAFALRLTYIEAKVLLVWCVYCVSSQAIIAAIFLLALISAVMQWRAGRRQTRSAAA